MRMKLPWCLCYLCLLLLGSSAFQSLQSSMSNLCRIPARVSAKLSSSRQSEQYSGLSRPNEVLRECRRTGDYALAIELAEKLESQPVLNAQGVTSCIRLYGEAKQLGRAISMLTTMEQLSMKANEHHFGALIHAARKAGQWEMAMELFGRMKSNKYNIEPNTIIYNSMISTAGDARDLRMVEDLIQEMETRKISKDTVTYSAAITACERCNKWQQAIKLYESMKKNADSDSAVKPNTYTLNAVLNACVHGRQWRSALEELARAREVGIAPDVISYSAVITALGDAKHVEMAMRLFKDMDNDGGKQLLTQYLKKVDNQRKRRKESAEKNEKNEEEMIKIDADERVSVISQSQSQPGTVDTDVDAEAAGGKIERDIEVDENFSDFSAADGHNGDDSSFSSSPSSFLGRKRVQPCDWSGVRKDTGTYNAMITACERNGMYLESLELLAPLVRNLEISIKMKRRNSNDVNNIIDSNDNSKSKNKNKNKSNSISNSNSNSNSNSDSNSNSNKGQTLPLPDSKTFSAVIAACGNAGQWQKALAVFNQMEHLGVVRDTVVYNTVIAALQNAGQYTKAQEFLPPSAIQSDNSNRGRGATVKYFSVSASTPSNTNTNTNTNTNIINRPQNAQELYIQGLSEGMLKHWSNSSGYSNRDKDNGNGNANNKGLAGSDAASELLYWWRDVVNKELIPAGKRAVESGSKEEMLTVLGKLNFDSFRIDASDSHKQTKEMDLHGFPLSVAKAAIDFVFNEIVETVRVRPITSTSTSTSTSRGRDIDRDNDRDRDRSNASASENDVGVGGDGDGDSDDDIDSQLFDLRVITGRGNHINSSGTRGILREEIEQHVKDMEPQGILQVEYVAGNDGVIVVTKKSIRAWVEATNKQYAISK